MSSPLKIMSRVLTHPNPHISKYPRSPTTTNLTSCTVVRVFFLSSPQPLVSLLANSNLDDNFCGSPFHTKQLFIYIYIYSYGSKTLVLC